MNTNYINTIKSFKDSKILVVGDIMLDRFIYGSVERISPEAPVPVVKVTKDINLLGGSANVVNNIVALNGNADICGLIGKDLYGESIIDILNKRALNISGVIIDKDIETTVKTRVIAHKQQVVRVDRENLSKIKDKHRNLILQFINKNINNYNAVILSDYGKGLVNKRFYNSLLKIIKDNKKILNIDPKNVNVDIYSKPTLLTPNITEAGYAAKERVTMDNLHIIGEKLLKKFSSEYLIITLGENGMAIFKNDNFTHIPTVAKEVYDVTGAGDTVIAVLTLAMSLGVDVIDAAKISNIAAGIVVGKIGTATVTQQELLSELEQYFKY